MRKTGLEESIGMIVEISPAIPLFFAALNKKVPERGSVKSSVDRIPCKLSVACMPILSGYKIFHNYIRGHQGLEGKTPADACGIEVKGKNKWKTLIQNASLSS